MSFRSYLIFFEVVLITILDYKMATEYYTLDVLYCLPVIQAASTEALSPFRRADSKRHVWIAIFCALSWSVAEAGVIWPDYPLNAFVLNSFTRVVTFIVIARVISKVLKEKGSQRIDILTGLVNRDEFVKQFEERQLHSERTGKPYSLLSISIKFAKEMEGKPSNHFEENDLVDLADLLRENIRGIDIASRINSEVFMLLLPETNEHSCKLLKNRIAMAVEKRFGEYRKFYTIWSGQITEIGNKREVDELLSAAFEQTDLLVAIK